jgi:polyhydroxybutyrate depolymerase
LNDVQTAVLGLLWPVLALSGCRPATPSPIPAPSATAGDTPAAAAPTPAFGPLTIGLSLRRVDVNGTERTYYLYVPKDFSIENPLSVVMVFHGYGQEGGTIIPAAGFNPLADSHSFLAVYPNGSGPEGQLSWNAGGCCGYALENGVDDVAFVRRILVDLGGRAAVDPRRIFAAGFSNGGILAYRLACRLSDVLAAVAPVSAAYFADGCRPSEPVSVIHIHGSADEAVPFAGGTTGGMEWPPVEDGLAAWAAFNGCSRNPLRGGIGMATRIFYSGCDAGSSVELFLLKDIGHRWPPDGVWPASRTIWEFFSAHPKREK